MAKFDFEKAERLLSSEGNRSVRHRVNLSHYGRTLEHLVIEGVTDEKTLEIAHLTDSLYHFTWMLFVGRRKTASLWYLRKRYRELIDSNCDTSDWEEFRDHIRIMLLRNELYEQLEVFEMLVKHLEALPPKSTGRKIVLTENQSIGKPSHNSSLKNKFCELRAFHLFLM